MIFYFSGTGNSLYAAKNIAEAQGEKLISISKEFDNKYNMFEYELKNDDLIGFVFPVYAWGPPYMVIDFINRMKLSGGKPYIFSVCTCGDEEGKSTQTLQKSLGKKGLALDSAYTILMPNNYILGFDVDSKDVENEKLQKSEQILININEVLKNRQRGIFNIFPGKFSTLKSGIVNPLFNHFALSTKSFYATEECTSCGICEKVCPVHSITVDKKPMWSKSCTQCLACIHRCPAHAIQYGKVTKGKGRYIHPDLR